MTKTTNYQLNQWAKTDRILMDDFNADNAKLDEALAVHAAALAGKAPMALLHDVTLAEDAKEIVLDMGAKNWSSYGIVLLAYTPGSSQTYGELYLRSDETGQSCTHAVLGTDVYHSTQNLAISGMDKPMVAAFFPCKSARMSIASLCFHYAALDSGNADTGYDGKLRLVASRASITAGANVKVYGLL